MVEFRLIIESEHVQFVERNTTWKTEGMKKGFHHVASHCWEILLENRRTEKL